MVGRTRVESDRWVTFRSHYGFDVFYCRPGVEGAHEKGGVEGEGGRFRRTNTVPVPKVDTLADLNAHLAKCDTKDDHRRVGQRTATVGDDFAVERTLLRPLPAESFETGIVLRPRVDRHARVTVRQCQYSVPVRYVGRQLRVLLRATRIRVYDGPRLVAEHAHLPSKKFNANAPGSGSPPWRSTSPAPSASPPVVDTAGPSAATVRALLIHTPARIATSGRRIRLHLPTRWQGLWTTIMSS